MRCSSRPLGTLPIFAALFGLAACTEDPVRPEPRILPSEAGPSFAIVAGVGMRNLGGLTPTADARASAINDHGVVVGWSTSPDGLRAVLWTPGEQIRKLEFGGPGDAVVPADINNHGQIVGHIVNLGVWRAFRWTEAGGLQELPNLGGQSAALRINNNGDIVGWSHTPAGMARPVVWMAPDYQVRDLGMLPEPCSREFGLALGVNDRREVVGTSCQRAFIWRDGQMHELASLSDADLSRGAGTGGFAINNAGYIAGFAATKHGYERAALWTPSGEVRELGALPNEAGDWPTPSAARDINERGEITGDSHYRNWRGGQVQRAFLWVDGEMRDLGSLYAHPDNPFPAQSVGHSINNHGQIVGYSKDDCCEEAATIWDITYANSAPVVDAGGPYIGFEGELIDFFGTATDQDNDALEVSWTFGDGAIASTGNTSHAYEDDGSFTATFTATDPKGLTHSDDASVIIENVAPRVTADASAAIHSGGTFNLSASFSDPGTRDNPWTTSVDWADGPPTHGTTSNQSALITGSHQYFRAGTYTVRVTVTDKDGGVGEATVSLEVARFPTTIDVDPLDRTNTISMRHGWPDVAVVLFSTETFDARLVDPASVLITNGSGSGTRLRQTPWGLAYGHFDVNKDGRADLVLSFPKRDMIANRDLTEATTTLILFADASDGRQTRGENAVSVR